MRDKVIKLVTVTSWRRWFFGLGAISAIGFLFTYQLDSLLPGASSAELSSIASSSSLSEIIKNPLFLPHSFAQHLLFVSGLESLYTMRLISVIFAILLIIVFYKLATKWHSTRIAILATTLLATSSWLLAIGRSATPVIMFTSWLGIIYALFLFRHAKNKKLALELTALLAALMLYIPGTIYLIFFVALWKAHALQRVFLIYGKKHSLIAMSIFTLLLIPLVYAFIQNPKLISDWLLFPETIALNDFFRNIITLPATYFYEAPINPEFRLGNLPLLDVFSGTMMLLGIYSYRYYIDLKRTPFMGLSFLLAILIIGFAGQALTVILLPFSFLLIASGISFMLDQWFTVFPRNPIARAIGTTLISVAVIVTCFYHISRYYVAWPNAPETKSVYTNRQ